MQSSNDTSELLRTAQALETGVAFRERPDLAAVRVRGDDRVTWLNGQITNDVRQIPSGGSVHALAVNVRGKIMAEVWVADLGESLLLLLPASAETTLLESLERFIIMEDVVLERAPELKVLALEGPLVAGVTVSAEAAIALHGDLLGGLGRFWVGTAEALGQVAQQLASAGILRASEVSYDLARLRRGVPRYGTDYDDHNYPQEAGLKDIVSFQKGCYLGQEVVCTLENRGKLSRRLCVLQGTSETLPTAGSPLTAADGSAASEALGTVTSAVWDPERQLSYVLGYVRRAYVTVGATVQAGSQALTLVKAVGEDEPTRS